jgi:hypothetical protein
VLVTGGDDVNGNGLATAELFGPASGSFTLTGSIGIGRARHTATLLKDGTVLVTGGDAAIGPVLATAELFDPTTGTFAQTGSMATRRYLHTATLLNNGMVLVTGGSDGFNTFATAELYQ